MSVLVQVLAGVSLVLAAFFVFLPKRREHFAEVLTLSVLALVLCSGFKSLSSRTATARAHASPAIAESPLFASR